MNGASCKLATVALLAFISVAALGDGAKLTHTPPPPPDPEAEARVAEAVLYTKTNTPRCYHDHYRPKGAERSRFEGTVILRVHILENGRADQVKVEKSSGRVDFDVTAAGCIIDQARFDPPTLNGRIVNTWARMAWNWTN